MKSVQPNFRTFLACIVHRLCGALPVALMAASLLIAPAKAAPEVLPSTPGKVIVKGAYAKGEHVDVELVPEVLTIQPGQPFSVAVRLKPEKDWHSYWKNAGDAGLATTIKWTLPEGFQAGDIQWPAPKRLPVPGDVVNYGYEAETMLLTQVTAPANLPVGRSVQLKAHVAWLVCAEVCVPGEANLTAPVKVVAGAPQVDPKWVKAFAATRQLLPVAIKDWTFRAETTDNGYNLVAEPARPGAVWPTGDVFFFSQDETVIESGAAQPVKVDGARHILNLTKASFAVDIAKRLHGVLVAPVGWTPGAPSAAIDIAVSPPNAAGSANAPAGSSLTTLAGSLAFALIGGLILNLMPCVFPVLGLKIVGFAQQAGEDRRKVTLHGLVFTAGVLLSFWGLAGLLAALRAGGDQLGWGFQLQSPGFVFALALIMLAFALNLSGVYEFGTSATGVGSGLTMKSGLVGTFFTGFLATVVATPCSAPFLAPALGAALALPIGQSFLVFTFIGIGLSLPYLLLSIFPSAVKLLPRPGRWMETFKQVMAFPLYATVAYLMWVMAGQVSDDGLLNAAVALVLVGMGAWAYGRWNAPGASASSTRFATSVLILLVAAGAWLGWPRTAPAGQTASAGQVAGVPAPVVWDKWSPEAVEKLRSEGRTIYVDFTARWCATCQTNKKLVFHSDQVLKTFADKKIATLRADWTNADPAITAELAKYRRSAIPFNLVYKPDADQPSILPEILTPDIVLKAVS